jgi:hypothetical protein
MGLIVVKDEISISAPSTKIWKRLTDINSWGQWTHLIRHSAVYGSLSSKTEFKCNIGKWDFIGVITEVEVERRFAAHGRTIGLKLDITWVLKPSQSFTMVSSSIEASGWIARIFKSRTEQTLKDYLFSWLYSLKTSSERGETPQIKKHVLTRPLDSKTTFLGPLSFFLKGSKEKNKEE